MFREQNILRAFEGEFRKIAFSPHALGSALTLGTGGGLLGAYQGYTQARDQGQDVGSSLRAGAIRGGKGALIGGAVGGGIGAAGPLGGEAAKSISHFGQRQLHSMTGWAPGHVQDKSQWLRGIGGGAHDASERLHAASTAKDQFEAAQKIRAGSHPLTVPAAVRARAIEHARMEAPEFEKQLAGAITSHDRASKGFAAAEKAEQMGMTSLPGVIKSVKDNGLLPTLSAGAAEQLHDSPVAKALTFGVPSYMLYRAATSTPGQDEQGLSKGQRVGKEIGGLVGGIAGAPVPIVGQMVMQEGGERLGKTIGGLFGGKQS